MTCRFLNSAGTDLDSLFLVNNSNAGALGFQTSAAQDLGNRFATGSLGYSVGYRNSANTDIGTLRGNSSAPVFSAYNATMNNLYNSGKTQCWHSSGEDQYSHAQRYMRGYIYVTGSCSRYGSSAPTWQVCICHYHTEGGYTHRYRLAVVADSTAQVTPSPCIDSNPDRLAANTEGPWITVKNNASGASRSMNIAFGLYSNDGRGGNSYGECIRVYQRFYNSYGTTSWVSKSFNFGS